VGVAKATKATKATKRMVQHTWKVTRRNNQTIDITADTLVVVYGDLVFSTKGVVVRVIGVDTYNDVELVSPLEP
jgi:magnesium-transporting ATPase (P-type)